MTIAITQAVASASAPRTKMAGGGACARNQAALRIVVTCRVGEATLMCCDCRGERLACNQSGNGAGGVKSTLRGSALGGDERVAKTAFHTCIFLSKSDRIILKPAPGSSPSTTTDSTSTAWMGNGCVADVARASNSLRSNSIRHFSTYQSISAIWQRAVNTSTQCTFGGKCGRIAAVGGSFIVPRASSTASRNIAGNSVATGSTSLSSASRKRASFVSIQRQ